MSTPTQLPEVRFPCYSKNTIDYKCNKCNKWKWLIGKDAYPFIVEKTLICPDCHSKSPQNNMRWNGKETIDLTISREECLMDSKKLMPLFQKKNSHTN